MIVNRLKNVKFVWPNMKFQTSMWLGALNKALKTLVRAQVLSSELKLFAGE
jgi:hypothetical protein